MKLGVVSTVAYHPAGLDMHLRNIRWALDCSHDIHIFTRSQYKFERADAKFYCLNDERSPHLDYHNVFLPEIAQNYDVLLFLQLDFPLTRKLKEFLEICSHEHSIVIPKHARGDYFAIFRQGVNVYPRIWEGGTLLGTGVLRSAIREGVKLGFGISAFAEAGLLRKKFADVLHSHEFLFEGKYTSLYEHLAREVPSRRYQDLMTELTIFSFCSHLTALNCDDFAVHLPGVETLHRRFPAIYSDPSSLLDIKLTFESQRYFTAVMLLLSGVANRSQMLPIIESVAHSEKKRAHYVSQLSKLRKHGHEWMNPHEIQALDWCLAAVV